MNNPVVSMMEDGNRLHCQYGPIDLVIEARGDAPSVSRAYQAAAHCFEPVLQQLVDELTVLRTPLDRISLAPSGPVATRMWDAIHRMHHGRTVTPMIAVAGSVADHVLAAMAPIVGLTEVYVNNGGDIALWLAPGREFSVAICDDPVTASLAGRFTISAADQIGGIATSGWRGRSLSLGIADAVTVTARCAADADVAATLIANAVDLPGHQSIDRVRAIEQDPDSDLGEKLVTIGVGELTVFEVEQALSAGAKLAQSFVDQQLVSHVALGLNQQVQVVGEQQRLLEKADVLC